MCDPGWEKGRVRKGWQSSRPEISVIQYGSIGLNYDYGTVMALGIVERWVDERNRWPGRARSCACTSDTTLISWWRTQSTGPKKAWRSFSCSLWTLGVWGDLVSVKKSPSSESGCICITWKQEAVWRGEIAETRRKVREDPDQGRWGNSDISEKLSPGGRDEEQYQIGAEPWNSCPPLPQESWCCSHPTYIKVTRRAPHSVGQVLVWGDGK